MMLSHRVALNLLDVHRGATTPNHARSVSGTSVKLIAADRASAFSRIFALNHPVVGENGRRNLVTGTPVAARSRVLQVASSPVITDELNFARIPLGRRRVGGVDEASISQKLLHADSGALSDGRDETKRALKATIIPPAINLRAGKALDHATSTNHQVMMIARDGMTSATSTRAPNNVRQVERLARAFQPRQPIINTPFRTRSRANVTEQLHSVEQKSRHSNSMMMISSRPAAGPGQLTASSQINRWLPSLTMTKEALAPTTYSGRSDVVPFVRDSGSNRQPPRSPGTDLAKLTAPTSIAHPFRLTEHAVSVSPQSLTISSHIPDRSMLDTQQLHTQVVPILPRNPAPVSYSGVQLPQDVQAGTASGGGLLDNADHTGGSVTPVAVHLTGDVMIDGRRLGRLMASSQARDASLPAQGPSRVNLRTVPIYSGMQIPR